MKKLKYKSTFLLPKTSFWTGMSSILNIAGGNTSLFNSAESGEEADLKALRSDWGVVGQDFEIAMEKTFK
ncbi:MAG: hypothetical protein RIQ70_407 [Bacteroidota bacterium]|jgi:hypothetical protein